MAAGDERRDDFYKVMGLKKECSSEELRTAYKKLAMKWHPDRFFASSTDLEQMEKVKNKFQSIQEAYSVLSDTNKRFLYDVGVYDNNGDDDDDENGMGDFLGEMADMMRQTKPTETGSFEELQDLFNDMFQDDMNGSSTSYGGYSNFPLSSFSSNFFSTPFTYSSAGQNLKRDNDGMTSGRRATAPTTSSATHSAFSYQFSSPEQTFCFGMSNSGSSSSNVTGSGGGGNRRKNGRKQKVSSRDSGISAN